jgi:hypothetical protein
LILENSAMGMDRTVTLPSPAVPAWETVAALLGQHHFAVDMRMIDGQLAFPDEAPPQDWQELRVGTPQGMVTVRRAGNTLVFVTWGNADAPLRQAWNALAWAFATTGGGQVQTEEGPVDPAAFRTSAELPEALRGGE